MSSKITGLYAIIDTAFSPKYSHAELAHLVLLGGCRLLQLRMKNMSLRAPERGEAISRTKLYSGDRHALAIARARDDIHLWNQEVYETAQKIMEMKRQFGFTFIINDYIDVAGEVGADGVHVGANDLPINEVRKRVGGKVIIGYSSHSLDEALAAEVNGADYIAFGAIFPTKTKGPGHPVQGIEKLKKLCSKIKKPIVAIGGINRTNINDVIGAGADAAAMITGITQAEDVVREVQWYINKFQL